MFVFQTLPTGGRVGVDPFLMSAGELLVVNLQLKYVK